MKQLFLPISLQYIAHWGRDEGIRELIANARDTVGEKSHDVIFNVLENSDGTMQLTVGNRTDGDKLETRHLVMGVSEHRNSVEAIGQFGEGLKLAIISLLREAPDEILRITNHDEVWTIRPVANPEMGDVVMPHLTIEECEPQGHVLFHIDGMSKQEVSNVMDMVWDFVPTHTRRLKNDEIELVELDGNSHRASKLYVGGIAMGEYESGFAVNTIPYGIDVNRDRKMPNSMEEVQERLRNLLAENFKQGSATVDVEPVDKDMSDFMLTAALAFSLFEDVRPLHEVIREKADLIANSTLTDADEKRLSNEAKLAEISYWVDMQELERDFKARWGYSINEARANDMHIHNNWWKANALKSMHPGMNAVGDDVIRRASRLANSNKPIAEDLQEIMRLPVSTKDANQIYSELHDALYAELSELMEAGDAAQKTNALLEEFHKHLVK